MTVDIFSRSQFEQVLSHVAGINSLPKFLPGTVAECVWVARLVKGEWQYLLKLDDRSGIAIRSSVRDNGSSANAGEDSIRVWLVCWDGTGAGERNAVIKFQFVPLGGKLGRYITRVEGWETRLTTAIGKLGALRLAAGDCPHCHNALYIYRVRKAGANHGRLFAKCDCPNGLSNTFKWLETGNGSVHSASVEDVS